MFESVSRMGIADCFMTASKIFKTSTLSSIKHSINMKSKSRNLKGSNMKSKIIPKQMKGNEYFNKIEEVNEEVYD
jgi:hypothetical protein